MRSETICLESAPSHIINEYNFTFCAGGSPGRAYTGAERLLRNGANALVSFGIAGALDPTLTPGQIVLAKNVIDSAGKQFQADKIWHSSLTEILTPHVEFSCGSIATVEIAATTPTEKASLFARTGALAVDMESSGVAAAATRHNIPFIAIRAIADPASRRLPKSALEGLAPDGTTRLTAVLLKLALRPWELPGLMLLGRDTSMALGSLRSVAALGF
jgi:adenosylhomocysteine nucleosidase